MATSLLIILTPVVIAAIIGYLAQWVGLCMVRGVNELLAGKPNFIAAICCSGLWVWVALISSSYIGYTVPLQSFSTNLWFVFGGLIFGLGTAFNQGCGVSTLSLLFTFEPQWAPSALLRDVSAATIGKSSWPTISRFGIFGALTVGMMLAAWRHQKFKLSIPNLTTIGIHLLAGILMGIGGAIAMGGNDAQLILALPTLSLSSVITITSMIIGIIIGLKLPELTKTLSSKLQRRPK